jgi:hypothetical protein
VTRDRPIRYTGPVQKLLLLSLLCLPLAAYGGESIELQDGTKIEGRILSVTSDAVTIEVQTSPTIRGEKSYPRADVAKIRRAGQDDMAFEDIARITAPATADDTSVYESLLEPVRNFMQNYAYSKHMPQARQLVATLESERDRVASGDVKVDGEWIPADVSPAERTELGGRVQLSKMKAATDPSAALAAFEVLEKSHNTSSSYPEAVKVAIASIEQLRANVVRAGTDLDRRIRKQAQGFQLASEDRRLQMEAGIAQEKAAIQAQIDRVKQSGGKWLPVLPDANVLGDLSKLADSEEARLSKIDTAKLSAAIEAARIARQQLDAGDLEGAKASLEEAQKSWSQYVSLASLKELLKKAQDEAARRAKEEAKASGP